MYCILKHNNQVNKSDNYNKSIINIIIKFDIFIIVDQVLSFVS